MNKEKSRISELIIQAAIVFRKCNLGDKDLFKLVLSKYPITIIEESWNLALNEIQNREIVKDANTSLSEWQLNRINEIVNNFSKIPNDQYRFLISPFNPKDFNLSDEVIQRRIRHIIAEKYLEYIINELNKVHLNRYNIFFKRVEFFIITLARRIFRFILISFGILTVIAIIFSNAIIQGLTPPEKLLNKYLESQYPLIDERPITENVLANYFHENSKYEFSGAVCNDGWISHSQGRGTCSHHGGIQYYFYEGQYSKTIEECKSNAKDIIESYWEKAKSNSWIDTTMKSITYP